MGRRNLLPGTDEVKISLRVSFILPIKENIFLLYHLKSHIAYLLYLEALSSL